MTNQPRDVGNLRTYSYRLPIEIFEFLVAVNHGDQMCEIYSGPVVNTVNS